MILSKEQFIRLLEERRDIEIPKAVEQLQAKIESLSKEKVDIDCQIKHLKSIKEEKTIFDIPPLVWREIIRYLLQPQNELHLSLASEELAETVFEQSSDFIKMEKAFSVLLTNFYLDQEDLLNCLETTSAELGKLASRTWHFLENAYCETVDVIKSKSFQAEIESRKAEHELWSSFAGRTILFKLKGRPPKSWNESRDILQKYGKFFVYIELQLGAEDLETGEKTDYIHNMLLDGKLPNLQFFYLSREKSLIYELRPQIETRSLQTSICLWTFRHLDSVKNYEALLKLPAFIAEAWYNEDTRCVISFKKLKSLTYHDCDEDEELANSVIAAQTNGLLQIKQLALNSYLSLGYNLQFAEKFPALSEIHFIEPHNRTSETEGSLIVPRNIRIPTVRTLTYDITIETKLPHLRDLFSVFPSLRCFTLTTVGERHKFLEFMQDVVKRLENVENSIGGNDAAANGVGDFDIYQRISNDQPLTESDVWAQVPTLNVLSIFITQSYYFEKYTRGFDDREYIRLEKYKEIVAEMFPFE